MQVQLQPPQESRDQVEGLLRRLAASADYHEVVAVSMELTNSRVTIAPPPVQRMQIDVGQKGADHPALGNATPGLVPLAYSN
jgi:hypothetical protein